MPLSFEWRPAVASDVEALRGFVNAAYRGEGSKAGWTTEADLLGGQRTDEDMLRDMLGTPDARIELALAEGTLAGCVYLRREPPDTCYLGMLTVAPARQRGGMGQRLLDRSEDLARAWGCVRVRMTVLEPRAELIAYYERRGYRRTGATEPFPERDSRFGLPKVRGLRFVELAKRLGAPAAPGGPSGTDGYSPEPKN